MISFFLVWRKCTYYIQRQFQFLNYSVFTWSKETAGNKSRLYDESVKIANNNKQLFVECMDLLICLHMWKARIVSQTGKCGKGKCFVFPSFCMLLPYHQVFTIKGTLILCNCLILSNCFGNVFGFFERPKEKVLNNGCTSKQEKL